MEKAAIYRRGIEGADLRAWWVESSKREIDGSLEKIKHYGAADLSHIGRVWAARKGMDELTEAEYAELGCLYYMSGKMSRIESAITRGEFPDGDSVFDLLFYAKMVFRLRASGAWPGHVRSSTPSEPQGGISEDTGKVDGYVAPPGGFEAARGLPVDVWAWGYLRHNGHVGEGES